MIVEEELWKKTNYINPAIPFVFNKDIIEYDMEEAGYNIGLEYNLFSESQLKQLENTSRKKDRTITIGKFERSDKKFKELHQAGFELCREQFIKSNELSEDNIISIKKDAIIVAKKCKNQKFGEYINFRPKNNYTSYVNLGIRHLELYYNSNKIDVKGINDEVLPVHKDGMLDFFNKFFNSMETKGASDTIPMLRRFIDNYKWKKLPLDYYRRFDNTSKYDITADLMYYNENDIDMDDIDIGFNLLILNKLVKLCLVECRYNRKKG